MPLTPSDLGYDTGGDAEILTFETTGGKHVQGVAHVREDETIEPPRMLAIEVTSSGLSTAATYSSGDQVGAVLQFTGAGTVGRVKGAFVMSDADSGLSGDSALVLLLYRDDPSGSAPGNNNSIGGGVALADFVGSVGVTMDGATNAGKITSGFTDTPYVTDAGSLWAIVMTTDSGWDFATATGLRFILWVEPA